MALCRLGFSVPLGKEGMLFHHHPLLKFTFLFLIWVLFCVIPRAGYYLMGIIIYESWIRLLWNTAREAGPFRGWSPYDGTAQYARGKLYKLGLASVRIQAWRPAWGPACFTCANKASDVMSGESSPLYQVWQFSSLHPSGLPVFLPLHSVSSSCWCIRALFFTGTLSWIKSFLAISLISSWEGRKPTHTFVLASLMRLVNFPITVCGIAIWWEDNGRWRMTQLSPKSHLMDSFFLFYIFESVGKTSWLIHSAFLEAHACPGSWANL